VRLNGSTMGAAGVIVATISLAIAISTGAIALPGKNSVDSGDIEKNAVKSKHLAASALKCPANMRRVGALCYDKQARTGAGSHLQSLYTCATIGRELPSWTQLLRVAHTGAYPTGEGELWTSTIVDSNALTVSKIASNNIPSLVRPVGNNFKFRCVKEATP
jgi:hypothetical protein